VTPSKGLEKLFTLGVRIKHPKRRPLFHWLCALRDSVAIPTAGFRIKYEALESSINPFPLKFIKKPEVNQQLNDPVLDPDIIPLRVFDEDADSKAGPTSSSGPSCSSW